MQKKFLVLFGLVGAFGLVFGSALSSANIKTEKRIFTVSGRSIKTSVVQASFNNVRLGVALAGAKVGANAGLANIAKNAKAICAINGTYLAAYAGQSGEPYGTLNIEGRWLHLGSLGTRLDVLEDESLRLVKDDLRVLGSLDDSEKYPNNWYGYGINQTPTNKNYSYIYTSEYGPRLTFNPSVAVRVEAEQVIEVGSNTSIPSNGYVIALGGAEARQLASRFVVGKKIAYRIESKTGQASESVRYSLGAGPRLLANGKNSLDAVGEGFGARVARERGTFSLLAWNNQEIFFVILEAAILQDGVSVAQQLGATEAMRLDGGSSSGLYCNNQVLVKEGRLIANALVLWEK